MTHVNRCAVRLSSYDFVGTRIVGESVTKYPRGQLPQRLFRARKRMSRPPFEFDEDPVFADRSRAGHHSRTIGFDKALGVTTGLAALPVVFAADLLGAAAALTGFFCADLAAVPAFETALLVPLFAALGAAATLVLDAGFAAAVVFFAVLAAVFTGLAAVFALDAAERAGAALTVLALVSVFLTGFFVAMGRSTIGYLRMLHREPEGRPGCISA